MKEGKKEEERRKNEEERRKKEEGGRAEARRCFKRVAPSRKRGKFRGKGLDKAVEF